MSIKIFLLEDDKNLNKLIESYLIKNNYIVETTFDGEEALGIILEKNFDMYILDIMIPNGNGLDIMKEIRKRTFNPILIITAIDLEQTEIRAFELGTDDYITKPFSPGLLVKRIEAILRRANKSVNNKMVFQEYVLDLVNYRILYKEEELKILNKEFEIIKLLLENKNNILSRQKILDSLWGYDYFGSDRIVDAHIKNIRKKIPVNIIHTIKNIGYVIKE